MLVIGIVGGVASGKSYVTRCLQDLGALVLDGDREGHEVLRDSDVEDMIRRRWGKTVFGSDGRVDRRALAGIVFSQSARGREELEHLEHITHPRIATRLRERIDQARLAGVAKAVVLDAAVLLEASWDKFCDLIVFVDTPQAVRRERARERGWSEDQFTAREASQWPLAEKRSRADFVIDGSTSRQQTRCEVLRFWNSVTK